MKKRTGKDLWEMYYYLMPKCIYELANTNTMKRLMGISMHCGCNYTKFPIQKSKFFYSRFDHSVGTALIVWRFTNDLKQSVAALFHDIATPTFAHVIDFVNKDYTTQESTEEYTVDFIKGSDEILEILKKYGLKVDDVCDYHRYPIADNDSPKLSADRLEYTLNGAYTYGLMDLTTAARIIDDLVVSTNESGDPEISFKSLSVASEFFNISLQCSKIYVADETRLAMDYLAELVNLALASNAITMDDLYKTEAIVISKFLQNENTAKCWKDFTKFKKLGKGKTGFLTNVPAKKRYIMPLCNGTRIAENVSEIKSARNEFIKTDFNKDLCIKCNNFLAEQL